jgi:MscS family membrane protein
MNSFISDGETPNWVENLPEQFHKMFMGVQVWQWLGLVLLIVVARIAMVGGKMIAVRILKARDRFLPGEVSGETHAAVRRAAGLLTGVLVCYPFTGPLDLPAKMDRGITITLEAMTILAFSMLAIAVWDTICDGMASRAAGVSARAERLLVPVTQKFVRAIILVVATFVALSTLFNVNVTAVIASLGLGGVVVALAAKDSVENIIGSVTILFDMPFAIGDWVRIDKIEGKVEEINIRSTRIRTLEDTLINLPNANLIRAAVENVSARHYRRQKINVRVAYGTTPDKIDSICDDLKLFLSTETAIDQERIIVKLAEADDIAMTILLQCHIEADTQAAELEVRHRILTEVARLRAKHSAHYHPVGVSKLQTT